MDFLQAMSAVICCRWPVPHTKCARPDRLQPTDILHQIICCGYVSRSDQSLTKRCHHVSREYTLSSGLESSRCFGPQKVPQSWRCVAVFLWGRNFERALHFYVEINTNPPSCMVWWFSSVCLCRDTFILQHRGWTLSFCQYFVSLFRLRQRAVSSFIICSPPPGQTTREAFELQESSTTRLVWPCSLLLSVIFKMYIRMRRGCDCVACARVFCGHSGFLTKSKIKHV